MLGRMNVAIAVAVFSSGSLAVFPACAQPPPTMAGPADNNYMGQSNGLGLAGFLTPEQRAVYLMDQRQKTKNMTSARRRAWERSELQKLSSLSQNSRQQLKIHLQAKWDALPQAQKDSIEQRLANAQTRQNNGLVQ